LVKNILEIASGINFNGDCAAAKKAGKCDMDLSQFGNKFAQRTIKDWCLVACDNCGKASSNCDVDINECDSNPCMNGATCAESTSIASISEDFYMCTCPDGFEGLICETDPDECASTPCLHGATCTHGVDFTRAHVRLDMLTSPSEPVMQNSMSAPRRHA